MPKMTSEHATSTSSIPQRSDDRLENNINDQMPNAEVAITATGSGRRAHLAAPTMTPEGNGEAESKFESILSLIDSIGQAQSSQEASHVPRVIEESYKLPKLISDEARSHQERDLGRAEPLVSSSIISSGAGGPKSEAATDWAQGGH